MNSLGKQRYSKATDSRTMITYFKMLGGFQYWEVGYSRRHAKKLEAQSWMMLAASVYRSESKIIFWASLGLN